MGESVRILCVMDSHLGELHNLVPMFFYWGDRGELKNCQIDFVYIGHSLNAATIQDELHILLPFVTINLEVLPIVSPRNPIVSKFFNFLRFVVKYMALKTYDLTFIPYDQRREFNFLFQLASRKLVAVPHTTGDEIYSNGVFKDRSIRSKKRFPVLVKSTASNEYFSALGFDDCIVSGKYFEYEKYLDVVTPCEDIIDDTKKLCIFTLSRSTKLFSEKNWLQVHYDILKSAAEAGFSSIFIKTHPSQSKEELDDLFIFAQKLSINLLLVSGNPRAAALRFDVFITVLTSAGQHAESVGKPVCCYASKSMRAEVSEFGNDPYPYRGRGVAELASHKELVDWLGNPELLSGRLDTVKRAELLSLEKLWQAC